MLPPAHLAPEEGRPRDATDGAPVSISRRAQPVWLRGKEDNPDSYGVTKAK